MEEFLVQLLFSIIFLFCCTILIFNGAMCSKSDAVQVTENKPLPEKPRPIQPPLKQIVREKTPVEPSIHNEDILSVGQIENSLTEIENKASSPINEPKKQPTPIPTPLPTPIIKSEPEIDSETESEPEHEPTPKPEPAKTIKKRVTMNFTKWDLSLSIAEEEEDKFKKLARNPKPPTIVRNQSIKTPIVSKPLPTSPAPLLLPPQPLQVKNYEFKEIIKTPLAQSSRKPSQVSLKSEIFIKSPEVKPPSRISSSVHHNGNNEIDNVYQEKMGFEEWDDKLSIKDDEERAPTAVTSRKPSSLGLNNELNESYKSVHSVEQDYNETIQKTHANNLNIKMGFNNWDAELSIDDKNSRNSSAQRSVLNKKQDIEASRKASTQSFSKVNPNHVQNLPFVSRQNSNQDAIVIEQLSLPSVHNSRKASSVISGKNSVASLTPKPSVSRQSFNHDVIEQIDDLNGETNVLSRKVSASSNNQDQVSLSRLPSVQNSRKSSSVISTKNQDVYNKPDELKPSSKRSSAQSLRPTSSVKQNGLTDDITPVNSDNELNHDRPITNNSITSAKSSSLKKQLISSRKASSVKEAPVNTEESRRAYSSKSQKSDNLNSKTPVFDQNSFDGDISEPEEIQNTTANNVRLKVDFKNWDDDIRIKESVDTSISLHTPINSESFKDISINNDEANDSIDSTKLNETNNNENYLKMKFDKWNVPLAISSP